MTDQTTDINAELDAVVEAAGEPISTRATFEALRRARGGSSALSVPADTVGGSIRLESIDDARFDDDEQAQYAEQRGAVVSLGSVDTEIAAHQSRLAYLDEQLGRITYDPRTGEPQHDLEPHRVAAFKAEREQRAEDLRLAQQIRERVLRRLAEEAANRARQAEIDAIEAEFTQGDRERAEALRKAQLEIEARHAAENILARRMRIA